MNEESNLGYSIYTNSVLNIYDLWVLGFSNKYLWECPTKHIEMLFKQHITSNHLDIGVGTGYYLEKCLDKTPRRLALLDLNTNSLIKASSRISDIPCELYKANILNHFDLNAQGFDSISLNYVLHCLPGNIQQKAIVFQNVFFHLNKGGVLFGSTILGKGVKKNYFAQKLMNFYNKKGIFSNHDDNLDEIESILQMYFFNVKIEVIGNVACFSAQKL